MTSLEGGEFVLGQVAQTGARAMAEGSFTYMQGMIETATCVHRSPDSRRNSETGTQHKRDRKQATKRDTAPRHTVETPPQG